MAGPAGSAPAGRRAVRKRNPQVGMRRSVMWVAPSLRGSAGRMTEKKMGVAPAPRHPFDHRLPALRRIGPPERGRWRAHRRAVCRYCLPGPPHASGGGGLPCLAAARLFASCPPGPAPRWDQQPTQGRGSHAAPPTPGRQHTHPIWRPPSAWAAGPCRAASTPTTATCPSAAPGCAPMPASRAASSPTSRAATSTPCSAPRRRPASPSTRAPSTSTPGPRSSPTLERPCPCSGAASAPAAGGIPSCCRTTTCARASTPCMPWPATGTRPGPWSWPRRASA